jgi:hypothetical protein
VEDAVAVRKHLQAVAHVAYDEERRPALARLQSLGVVLRLPAGVQHQHVPGPVGGAPAQARRRLVGFEQIGLARNALLAVPLAALLGFQDE